MPKRPWLISLVLMVVIGGGATLAVWNETRPQASSSTLSEGSATQAPLAYSLAQVAEHADATSCWTIIENYVYDLTTFIDKHPGGTGAILAVCGNDGTKSFQSMPTAVIPVARMTLGKYKLGVLAD